MSSDEAAERAIGEMRNELSGSQSESSNSGSESEEDGVIKMDFSRKPGDKTRKAKAQDKGVMGMKFMQKAEQSMKDQIADDTNQAISQIREERGLITNAAKKFGGKKLEISEPQVPEIASEKVIEAARQVTGQKPAKEEKKPKSVDFAPTDLTGFNTEKKSVVKETTGIGEEDKILQNIFVTDAAGAAEEFEADKNRDIEEQLDKKVQRPDIKQGWGDWAGAGVDESKLQAKRDKAEQARQAKIAQLKKER